MSTVLLSRQCNLIYTIGVFVSSILFSCFNDFGLLTSHRTLSVSLALSEIGYHSGREWVSVTSMLMQVGANYSKQRERERAGQKRQKKKDSPRRMNLFPSRRMKRHSLPYHVCPPPPPQAIISVSLLPLAQCQHPSPVSPLLHSTLFLHRHVSVLSRLSSE